MKRRSTRPYLLAFIVVATAVVLIVRHQKSRAVIGTTGASCYGDLNSDPYSTGFSSAAFSSMQAVKINSGTGPTAGLQLDTNLTPLNSQAIVLPFDQGVKIKYVYRNAGYSHSLGWFYFDQVQPYLDSKGRLADLDNDGVADFFQAKKTTAPTRASDGLFLTTGSFGSTPDIFNSGKSYSDGGSFGVIPNLLETFMTNAGGLIFKICDDDTDTTTNVSGLPASDTSTTYDGVPDYDVNGDGTIDNSTGAGNLDRTVDLGTFQGNREVVLYAMSYMGHGPSIQDVGVGLAPNGSVSRPWVAAKPGIGGNASGDVIKYTSVALSGQSGDIYAYMDVSGGNSVNTASGDCIEYDVYLGNSVSGLGGIDVCNTDGTCYSSESSSNWKDQNNVSGQPTANLSTWANATWYHRKLPVPSGEVNKQIAYIAVVDENDTSPHTYTAYYDNLALTNCGTTTKWAAYTSGRVPSNIVKGIKNSNTGTKGFSVPNTLGAVSGTPGYPANSVPWFTKNMLNPDFGAQLPGTVMNKIAIKCDATDTTCASGVGGTHGWMDAAARTASTRWPTATWRSPTTRSSPFGRRDGHRAALRDCRAGERPQPLVDGVRRPAAVRGHLRLRLQRRRLSHRPHQRWAAGVEPDLERHPGGQAGDDGDFQDPHPLQRQLPVARL